MQSSTPSAEVTAACCTTHNGQSCIMQNTELPGAGQLTRQRIKHSCRLTAYHPSSPCTHKNRISPATHTRPVSTPHPACQGHLAHRAHECPCQCWLLPLHEQGVQLAHVHTQGIIHLLSLLLLQGASSHQLLVGHASCHLHAAKAPSQVGWQTLQGRVCGKHKGGQPVISAMPDDCICAGGQGSCSPIHALGGTTQSHAACVDQQ